MNQQRFEAERGERWSRFDEALTALDRREPDPSGELPRLYRQVCQDLALARDRAFTEDLVSRLNRMALRGHEHMYAARAAPSHRILELVWAEFPRAVRREARLFLALSVLFFGSMGLSIAAVPLWPDLPRSFLSEKQLDDFEEMYSAPLERGPAEDFGMFGFYIQNNVSIAFNTFAGGLLFGVGSLVILLLNGVSIGLVTGHVIAQDMGTNFFTFVIGHGSFELTAIVLAGVSGLRLGLAVVAPGSHSRRGALRLAATRTLPVLYGTGGMLVIAAALEAFWSSSSLGPWVKYPVGAGLWLLVGLYLGLGGRTRGA